MTSKAIKQYVGLDVHKNFVYGTIKDKNGGVILNKKFNTEPQEIDNFLLNVRKNDSLVAIESCICWQYMYDYLTNEDYKVVLAHPVGVKALKKLRKHTDKHDANLLADLLRTNMLPRSYAAPWDVRVKRQITRHRGSLVNVQNEVMNMTHAILLRHGIHNLPYQDAFCKKGIEYLYSLDLPGCDRVEMDNFLEIIQLLEKKKDEANQYIEKIADDDPAVRLVMTMTGMGHFTATSFVAEVGDIRRFQSGDHLASFTGLVPKVHQSGETLKLGHITKQGNTHLRHVMVQAANIAVQHDKTLKKVYQRLMAKKGHNKAVVAVARKMVTLLYVMLKNNITYQALQIHKAT